MTPEGDVDLSTNHDFPRGSQVALISKNPLSLGQRFERSFENTAIIGLRYGPTTACQPGGLPAAEELADLLVAG